MLPLNLINVQSTKHSLVLLLFVNVTITIPPPLSQTEISFRPRVPVPGRYVVVLHYRQPEHPSFPVGVLVEAGRAWNGER